MKFLSTLSLSLLALARTSAYGQTKPAVTAHPATHATRSGAAGSCIPVGTLSSKIPALPSGTPCAKALYTVTVPPPVKLAYVSPLEDEAALHELFSVEANTFTLAYIDTKTGTGPLVAQNKYLSVLYTGYLPDGTEFDSSAKHGNNPIVIQYGAHNVIPGWDTGLDGMRVGGKRRLFIPFELGYGRQGHPPAIPAKSELIFDVELVAQGDAPPAPKTAPTPAANASPATSARPSAPPAGASGVPVQPATPPAATQPATQTAPTAKPQ